jgi:hypothetical protein
MTAPKPVEQVARDADAIGYVRGLNRAASWTRAFDQDLPGFDRPTCVNLARGLSEMARHAGERVGVAIDYNEPPAPMFHDCCVHDGHGEPVEVRVEWEVCWLATGGGIAMDEQHLPSREAAEVLGPTRVGQYNIVGFSVHHRTHRQFPDGSTWIGPWLDAEPADPWAEADRSEAGPAKSCPRIAHESGVVLACTVDHSDPRSGLHANVHHRAMWDEDDDRIVSGGAA